MAKSKAKSEAAEAAPETAAPAPKTKTDEEKILELTNELEKFITPFLKAGKVSSGSRVKRAVGILKQYFNK